MLLLYIQYGPKMSKSNSKRVRQPSIKDSSSSEEETLKENEDFKKEREKHRYIFMLMLCVVYGGLMMIDV